MSGAASASQFPTGGPFGSTDATDWRTPAQQAMRGRYDAYSAAYGPDYTSYLWSFLPAQLGGSGTAPGFQEPGVYYEQPMSFEAWGRLRDSFGAGGSRGSPTAPPPVVPPSVPAPAPAAPAPIPGLSASRASGVLTGLLSPSQLYLPQGRVKTGGSAT